MSRAQREEQFPDKPTDTQRIRYLIKRLRTCTKVQRYTNEHLFRQEQVGHKRRFGLDFLSKFDELQMLMQRAGITPHDLPHGPHGWYMRSDYEDIASAQVHIAHKERMWMEFDGPIEEEE